MATEPFLINPSRSNPPKRLKRRRNPVGEMLTVVGANPSRRNPMTHNPWYGDSRGHRLAALMRWGKIPRGKIRHRRKSGRVVKRTYKQRRVVQRKRGRWAPKHIRMRRKIAKQAFWTSKYGFMLAHPRSKKVFTRKGFVTMATKRKRRKSNTWFGQPRRHRKAAKKGWRRGHLVPFTHSRRSSRRTIRHSNPMVGTNPRRRRRSNVRYGRRRNPALMAEFGKFTSSIMNVREWAPLAVTGGLSAVTGAIAPTMLGVNDPWMKLGVQTAVAIGGGIVVERFVDKRHGQAWMIVGVAMVGYQLLKQFVFLPYFPQFAVGLGDYREYYPVSQYAGQDEVSQQVGAFPNQMSAFPNLSGYEGIGNEMSAYPYDGGGY